MAFEAPAWIVLALCSLGGVMYAVATSLQRDYYVAHDRWRDSPNDFAATAANALLLGLGTGLGVGFLILAGAAVWVRVLT